MTLHKDDFSNRETRHIISPIFENLFPRKSQNQKAIAAEMFNKSCNPGCPFIIGAWLDSDSVTLFDGHTILFTALIGNFEFHL